MLKALHSIRLPGSCSRLCPRERNCMSRCQPAQGSNPDHRSGVDVCVHADVPPGGVASCMAEQVGGLSACHAAQCDHESCLYAPPSPVDRQYCSVDRRCCSAMPVLHLAASTLCNFAYGGQQTSCCMEAQVPPVFGTQSHLHVASMPGNASILD
jgi:hypothetical protein